MRLALLMVPYAHIITNRPNILGLLVIMRALPTCIYSSSSAKASKGLVINYGEGGGATKWENHGSETFCAPPPLKTG